MKSYRQIFRSSAIIGSASLINILIGIVNVKVVAVLLGPAGIGLMGLYQSITKTATTLTGCGLDVSAVRQIAASEGDQNVLSLIRRSLLWGNFLLGCIGMLLLWAFRDVVAQLVFDGTLYAYEVGCLGLGVLLSLMASSQSAILQGMRRIGDVARVNILGSLVGTVIGITIISLMGHDGIHWFVITSPVASVFFSFWYVSRLPRMPVTIDWGAIQKQWQGMLRLGVPLMAATLLTVLTQIIARSLVMKNLGLEANGFFQAAWAISMTYIGFVLTAMATDYLPRLTAVINERDKAKKLVNEQTKMALLLAAPVLLAMLTLAPWVIELLYSKSFAPAIEILRWQVMGDILKVIGFPMGFIVLAQGRGDVFIGTQLNWNVLYLLSLWFGLESVGLVVVGIGFFFAYIVQVGLVRLVVGRLIGFTSEKGNIVMFTILLVLAGGILAISQYWLLPSLLFGGVATFCFSIYSVRKLNQLLDLKGYIYQRFGWLK